MGWWGEGDFALDLALNKPLTRIVRVCAMAVNFEVECRYIDAPTNGDQYRGGCRAADVAGRWLNKLIAARRRASDAAARSARPS